jgi:hypothetical protein
MTVFVVNKKALHKNMQGLPKILYDTVHLGSDAQILADNIIGFLILNNDQKVGQFL